MTLTDAQIRFVRLHQCGGRNASNAHSGFGDEYMASWQELMQGAQVRAKTSLNKCVTIARRELDALIERGLIRNGWGGAYYVTDEGKKL